MSVRILNWTESDGTRPIVLYDNLLVNATPSIADASSVLTRSTYDAWVFTHDNTELTLDLGDNKDFSAFACVGVRNGGEATLSYSDDNSTFTEITPTEVKFGRECCTLFVFNKRSARYFRVNFQGSGEAYIRSMWLSEVFEFPGGVGLGYTPIWLGQEKELLLSKTLNGQFVENRVVSQGSRTDIPMLSEERSFVEEDMRPFMRHYNDGKPFIWAAGPSVFEGDVAYVWRQPGGEMKPTFDQSGNWMSFTMSVEGYVN